MSVRSSVWLPNDGREILCLNIFRKPPYEIERLLESDKNNVYLSRSMHIYDIKKKRLEKGPGHMPQMHCSL
jgi:hypothetical protein